MLGMRRCQWHRVSHGERRAGRGKIQKWWSRWWNGNFSRLSILLLSQPLLEWSRYEIKVAMRSTWRTSVANLKPPMVWSRYAIFREWYWFPIKYPPTLSGDNYILHAKWLWGVRHPRGAWGSKQWSEEGATNISDMHLYWRPGKVGHGHPQGITEGRRRASLPPGSAA